MPTFPTINEQSSVSGDTQQNPVGTIDVIDPIRSIGFSFDEEANSWRSGDIRLTGDCYLSVTLPERGRLAIRKFNSTDAPKPVVLMSPHTGPDFEIRIYGESAGKYIRIETTAQPTKAELTPI